MCWIAAIRVGKAQDSRFVGGMAKGAFGEADVGHERPIGRQVREPVDAGVAAGVGGKARGAEWKLGVAASND